MHEQVFRLFPSSPEDAANERGRLRNVVSRLNGEFVGFARLAPVLWGDSYYPAYADFHSVGRLRQA